ncbi:hypothetical protein ETAA8_53110 [Anatilimnocola aggregata]|uniref:Uncharacterized protein n=1 Tax=Anatilimnocola aggregata TaxID=2528021 RepID=A0A517YIZ9_9BACT|nr:hypothetical protein ETAA8_53110 [Anatilimnocola aggregata]
MFLKFAQFRGKVNEKTQSEPPAFHCRERKGRRSLFFFATKRDVYFSNRASQYSSCPASNRGGGAKLLKFTY